MPEAKVQPPRTTTAANGGDVKMEEEEEEEAAAPPPPRSSPFERRRLAETGALLQQLASYMLQLPSGHYERAVALVRDLKTAMEEGKEVCLVRIESTTEVQ